MAYIWVNPVAAGMYEPMALDEFLARHGHKRLVTTGDWLTIVKEKYAKVVEQSKRPVMDMRCPKIKPLLEETGVIADVNVPEINPILIHCGEECSAKEELLGEEKIITTPCQALADMGNALDLENTRFIPWNKFVEELGGEPARIQPKESPIPPGFFDGMGMKVTSVTGEEELRKYFAAGVPDDVQLVEMLFCKEGCHNGDGIRKCER